jgi:hypothetical protein
MRVLIIKTSEAGEIISTLPILDYLKQVSRGIEIDWVVEDLSGPGCFLAQPADLSPHLARPHGTEGDAACAGV